MAKYVDGFVIVVPKNKLEGYKKMAKMGGKMWKKHGALDYKECVGEDMEPNMGGMKFLPFPKLAKTKPDEVVIFSYILYKSRKHRDQVNAKVMKEMEADAKKHQDMDMPWDMKKFSYGGFDVIVDA